MIRFIQKCFISIFFSLVLLCGCSKDEVFDSSLLTGEWVIKKGPITGFIVPGKYSQRIQFLENGNYSETVVTGSDATSSQYVQSVKKEAIGNWSVTNNELVINSWKGDKVSGPFIIKSLSQESLELELNGTCMYFVRAALEFNDLQKEVVGTWQSITTRNYKGRLEFNEDGTGSQSKPDTSFGEMGVGTSKTFRWWIENNRIMAKDNDSATPQYSFGPSFINDQYIGVGIEVMKKE